MHRNASDGDIIMPDNEFLFSPRPNRADRIKWHVWGDVAFEKARVEDSLVFLSISATWCHWCHVMDETAFSDANVRELLNTQFVPVRIDADVRPDVDHRYNQGGWPTISVLTPSGIAVTGGTYFDAPALIELLQQARSRYQQERDELSQRISDFEKSVRDRLEETVVPLEADTERIIDQLSTYAIFSFDHEHPGFGESPKFPHPHMILFMSELAVEEGDESLLELPSLVLSTMTERPVYDHHEGGFFRYSVRRDWEEPHTEKIVEDNAWLILAYAQMYASTKNDLFLETARQSVEYLLKTFTRHDGLLGSSQDADSSYYRDPIDKRTRRDAPPVDARAFTPANAASLLALRRVAAASGDSSIANAADRLRDVLIAHLPEKGRPFPHMTEGSSSQTLLRGNALAALAFLHEDDDAAAVGLRVLDSIDDLWWPSKGVYADRATSTSDIGMLRYPLFPLDENAFVAIALLIAAQLTRETSYAEKARLIIGSLQDQLQEYEYLGAALGLAALSLKRYEENRPVAANG